MFKITKEERIKNRNTFKKLFEEGNAKTKFPLRVIWIEKPSAKDIGITKFGVAVAKKKFPIAAHRNKIKRLIRESYRLNKTEILHYSKTNKTQIILLFIYLGKVVPEYAEIERAMRKLLVKVLKEQKKGNNDPTFK